MIGKLRGYVDAVRQDHVLLDVQGVGYRIYVSAQTLDRLRYEKEHVSLFIETHVREDHIHLYGFMSEAEQDMFMVLTTVQGVGNKMALAILSVFATVDIANIILVQDVVSLTRVSGIGKRIAERIVTELKNKMPSLELAQNTTLTGGIHSVASAFVSADVSLLTDAISALEHLGYSRSDAHRACVTAMQSGATTLDDVIKGSLKALA